MCIHTFVGAGTVYMLYDNTGEIYMHYVYNLHGVWHVYCHVCTVYLYVLQMLLCSITQHDVVAAGFSTHLENRLVSCGFPRFSTAVA